MTIKMTGNQIQQDIYEQNVRNFLHDIHKIAR